MSIFFSPEKNRGVSLREGGDGGGVFNCLMKSVLFCCQGQSSSL